MRGAATRRRLVGLLVVFLAAGLPAPARAEPLPTALAQLVKTLEGVTLNCGTYAIRRGTAARASGGHASAAPGPTRRNCFLSAACLVAAAPMCDRVAAVCRQRVPPGRVRVAPRMRASAPRRCPLRGP